MLVIQWRELFRPHLQLGIILRLYLRSPTVTSTFPTHWGIGPNKHVNILLVTAPGWLRCSFPKSFRNLLRRRQLRPWMWNKRLLNLQLNSEQLIVNTWLRLKQNSRKNTSSQRERVILNTSSDTSEVQMPRHLPFWNIWAVLSPSTIWSQIWRVLQWLEPQKIQRKHFQRILDGTCFATHKNSASN